MVDVFFMRPAHPESQWMKKRLSGKSGLNLQNIGSTNDIAQLNPRPGSIFIYHVASLAEVRDVLTNVDVLSKRSAATVSVVISDVDDAKTKAVCEALPNLEYFMSGRGAHALDLMILKIAKTQAAVTQTVREETLTYSRSVRNPKSHVSATVTLTSVTVPPKAEGKNVFQPITDPNRRDQLIEDAVVSQATCTLSNFGSKAELRGVLKDFDSTQNSACFEISSSVTFSSVFREQLESSTRLALSVSLQQSRVFFVCSSFRWMEPTALQIEVPSLIYSVQRRRDFRHAFGPDEKQRLVFDGASAQKTYRLCDLSAGGLAILVPAEDAAFLESTPTDLATIFVDNESFSVGSLNFQQKRFLGDDPAGSVFKMGFSFIQIKTPVKNRIANYVERKGRGYFMDFLREAEKKV